MRSILRSILKGEIMKRGSIELARRLCVDIAGFADEENDIDGNGYGSVDIAEILSAEVERLRAIEQSAMPEPLISPFALNAGLEDELVLFVEKSRWKHLEKEAGNRFCIQAYTTVENESGFIKFCSAKLKPYRYSLNEKSTF